MTHIAIEKDKLEKFFTQIGEEVNKLTENETDEIKLDKYLCFVTGIGKVRLFIEENAVEAKILDYGLTVRKD